MKALREEGINIHHNAQYTWAEDLKQRSDIKHMPKYKLCLVFGKIGNDEMAHIGK